ncbi:hypothetical protein LIER_02578 [Lithospermum erythrorhizon]|uniref:WEB family protein n=1 Tax=Lithospermum erythrorhizon TaxID=34254 RepID=A0AAV3NQP4_LITER
MEGDGGVRMMRKAEIDSSVPFRSVKEAVLLYGERVLGTEVYPNKIQQERSSESDDEQVKAELEETKESLQKAREQSMEMACCLSSLQEELERTRRELQHLKEQEKSSPSSSEFINKQQVRTIEPLSGELEHLKFMEDSTQFDHVLMLDKNEIFKDKVEFQKKRYVSFGNFPTPFTRVMVPPDHNDNNNDHHAAVLQRHPSLRKKKKKSLIPFIGGIFSRKKGSSSEMV